MNNKLTCEMIEELNLKLEEDNSCLRYVLQSNDLFVKSYRIAVIDKYISTENSNYVIPCITKEFESMVRNFFKDKFNVEDTGFSNSVVTIFTYN